MTKGFSRVEDSFSEMNRSRISNQKKNYKYEGKEEWIKPHEPCLAHHGRDFYDGHSVLRKHDNGPAFNGER
jgi:hypothetical protein